MMSQFSSIVQDITDIHHVKEDEIEVGMMKMNKSLNNLKLITFSNMMNNPNDKQLY